MKRISAYFQKDGQVKKKVWLQMDDDGFPKCDYQGIPHLYASYEEANLNGRAVPAELFWSMGFGPCVSADLSETTYFCCKINT